MGNKSLMHMYSYYSFVVVVLFFCENNRISQWITSLPSKHVK